MKSPLLLISAAVICFAFLGCSKSNSPSNGTQWTLNGTTYKGLVTTYDTSSGLGILTSADATGNTITVTFYSHPMVNGSYVVKAPGSANTTECTISVSTYISGTSTIYTSPGKAGDMLNLTISSNKLTASFTDITVGSPTSLT